jgi:hypothetical protein
MNPFSRLTLLSSGMHDAPGHGANGADMTTVWSPLGHYRHAASKPTILSMPTPQDNQADAGSVKTAPASSSGEKSCQNV